MSAFIVNEAVIDDCVRALYDPNLDGPTPEKLGQALWLMNAAAVSQRYNEALQAVSYSHAPSNASPGQVRHSLHCLRYQCSEGNVPTWPLFLRLDAKTEEIDATTPEDPSAVWDRTREESETPEAPEEPAVAPVNPRCYLQTWTDSLVIIDMTDAGKRGRKCRKFVFSGGQPCPEGSPDSPSGRAAQVTREALRVAGEAVGDGANYDDCREAVLDVVVAAGVPNHLVRSYDETIRAIDAPKQKLTAGVQGQWSAGADEKGISLHDLADVNQWTEITHKQTQAAAYRIARKVWESVRACRTLYEASKILRDAGARLHGFCGMD